MYKLKLEWWYIVKYEVDVIKIGCIYKLKLEWRYIVKYKVDVKICKQKHIIKILILIIIKLCSSNNNNIIIDTTNNTNVNIISNKNIC